MMKPAPDQTLRIEQVVAEGLCVGCGACAASPSSPFDMVMNDLGLYEPVRRHEGSEEATAAAQHACPFSGAGPNEDQIAMEHFSGLERDASIGHWRAIRAAHVTTGAFRERGTSGGMASWFLSELFRRDLIDMAIHVRPRGTEDDGPLFSYDVSTSAATSEAWVKSRYHVVEMSEAVQLLRRQPGRFAFVGVPCFVKALRLLVDSDEELKEDLVATIALVCGHLKSSRYAEYAAWQMGVPPGSLTSFDFRTKVEGRPANLYAMTAVGSDDRRRPIDRTKGAEEIRWADWGLGLFKLQACDYCDDVVGETADISLGDAWIPPYAAEWQGTNLVITRSALAEEIVASGVDDGTVHAAMLSTEDAAATQASGLRHRRAGLAIRLADRQQRGVYVPIKRVAPDALALSTSDGQRVLARQRVAIESHVRYREARQLGDLNLFFRSMRSPVKDYYGSSTSSLAAWLIQSVEKVLPNRLLTLVSKVHTERLARRRTATKP